MTFICTKIQSNEIISNGSNYPSPNVSPMCGLPYFPSAVCSSFMPLWSENIHRMILILYLLRLVFLFFCVFFLFVCFFSFGPQCGLSCRMPYVFWRKISIIFCRSGRSIGSSVIQSLCFLIGLLSCLFSAELKAQYWSHLHLLCCCSSLHFDQFISHIWES